MLCSSVINTTLNSLLHFLLPALKRKLQIVQEKPQNPFKKAFSPCFKHFLLPEKNATKFPKITGDWKLDDHSILPSLF